MTIITQKTVFYVGHIEQLPRHFCFKSQVCFVFGNDAQCHARRNIVWESAELTNKKKGKPTLHSLIANHVLEMSVKLKVHCVHFNRHRFALVILNRFPIFPFIKTCSNDATCIIGFFCTILLKPKK